MSRADDGACRWTRARLPLLAGGDLLGPDRRRAERHLIGCRGCRERLDAHQRSLELLHQAAAVSPSTADAPGLWPALARQIREERHPAHRTFSWGRGHGWTWSLPVSGLALAASMLVCIGLGGVVYHVTTSPEPLLAKRVRKLTPPAPVPAPMAEPEPTTVARAEIPSEDDLKAEDTPGNDTGGTR